MKKLWLLMMLLVVVLVAQGLWNHARQNAWRMPYQDLSEAIGRNGSMTVEIPLTEGEEGKETVTANRYRDSRYPSDDRYPRSSIEFHSVRIYAEPSNWVSSMRIVLNNGDILSHETWTGNPSEPKTVVDFTGGFVSDKESKPAVFRQGTLADEKLVRRLVESYMIQLDQAHHFMPH